MAAKREVTLPIKSGGRVVKGADGTARTRTYTFYPASGGLFVMNMDASVSDELERMIEELPRAGRSGLRKLAYFAVKGMKEDAKRGGPAGTSWKERSYVARLYPHGLRKDGNKRPGRKKMDYGILRRAIAYYRYPAPASQVQFGFLSRSSYMAATRLQEGQTFSGTRKMGKLFHLRGLHTPKKVVVPPRPLIMPSFCSRKRELLELFDDEIRRVFQRERRKGNV